MEFIINMLQVSTEYAITGKNLDSDSFLWNEGSRRLNRYGPEEVVGKANSQILYVSEGVNIVRHAETIQAALRVGKWEGTLLGFLPMNGERFPARVIITPRRDNKAKVSGSLIISKDISDEIRLTEELRATQYYARSLIEEALVIISPEGKITDVNEASLLVTGVLHDRLIGTDCSNYFTKKDEAREGYQ